MRGPCSSNNRRSVWLEGRESVWEWFTVYSRGKEAAKRWWATNWTGRVNHHRNKQEASCTVFLTKWLLTVPSSRGWRQRQYSRVLRKLTFLPWSSLTSKKKKQTTIQPYMIPHPPLQTPIHEAPLLTQQRICSWATQWEVPQIQLIHCILFSHELKNLHSTLSSKTGCVISPADRYITDFILSLGSPSKHQ